MLFSPDYLTKLIIDDIDINKQYTDSELTIMELKKASYILANQDDMYDIDNDSYEKGYFDGIELALSLLESRLPYWENI